MRSNGSVEVVPVYGYRTDEIGRVEVFCCGEECEWRDEHWFHQYVVAVAMGVLNVDGAAGFAADDYVGTVFVLLEDEGALHADQEWGYFSAYVEYNATSEEDEPDGFMSLEEALVAVGVFTSEQLPTDSERGEAEDDEFEKWMAMRRPVEGVDDVSSEGGDDGIEGSDDDDDFGCGDDGDEYGDY